MTREQKTALATAFYGWWARLHDPENNGRNAKRADRAALRRLDLVAGAEGPEPDVVAALSIPAFRELYGNLRAILPAASRREEDDQRDRPGQARRNCGLNGTPILRPRKRPPRRCVCGATGCGTGDCGSLPIGRKACCPRHPRQQRSTHELYLDGRAAARYRRRAQPGP